MKTPNRLDLSDVRLRLFGRDFIASVIALFLILCLAWPVTARLVEDKKLDGCKANLTELGKAFMVFRSTSGGRWPTVSTKPIHGAPCLTALDAKDLTEGLRRKDPKVPEIPASGYGWLTQLLPNLDENDFYNQLNIRSFRFSRDPFDIAIRNDAGEHLSMYPFNQIQCPAFESKAEIPYTSMAPEYQAFTKIIQANAVGKVGVALTNYVAVTATHFDLAMSPAPEKDEDRPNGVIVVNEKHRVAKIPDGDSNTIVVSETREPNYASWMDGTTSWVVAHDPNSKPPVRSKDKKGRWDCREEDGCRHALNVGPKPESELKPDEKQIYYREKWLGKEPWRYGPSAMHDGQRVNHLFADKRVVSIVARGKNAIDANVYLALVTRDGDESDKPGE